LSFLNYGVVNTAIVHKISMWEMHVKKRLESSKRFYCIAYSPNKVYTYP
jgi:hypothetical protein